jgi:hypothetical protein
MHELAARKYGVSSQLGQCRGLCVWLLLLSIGMRGSVRAEDPCEASFVRLESFVPQIWDAALRDACAELSTNSEVDSAVTVHVRFRAPDLLLVALRDDGRRTLRSVRDPAALATTLEALVMLPPEPVEAPQPPAAKRNAVATEQRDLSYPSETAPSPAHRSPIRVEFGAEVSGRLAWSPTYVSPALGLHVGFRIDRWMIGLDARSEPYQFPVGHPPSGFEMDGFGAGIFLTYRVIEAAVGLDLGARAFLGEENQALEMNELANQASVVDVRAGVVTRLLLGSTAPRWTIGLDAELSPMRLRREFKIYQYLPGVSVGLAFGVALESP